MAALRVAFTNLPKVLNAALASSLYMLMIGTARRQGETMHGEHAGMAEDILPFLSLSLLFAFSLSFSPFKGGVVTTRL